MVELYVIQSRQHTMCVSVTIRLIKILLLTSQADYLKLASEHLLSSAIHVRINLAYLVHFVRVVSNFFLLLYMIVTGSCNEIFYGFFGFHILSK